MTAFLNFQRQLNLWLEQVVQHVPIIKQDIILFLSYGPKDQRCSVWHSEKTNLEQAKKQLLDFINDQFEQAPLADYIKIDISYNLAKQLGKK